MTLHTVSLQESPAKKEGERVVGDLSSVPSQRKSLLGMRQ